MISRVPIDMYDFVRASTEELVYVRSLDTTYRLYLHRRLLLLLLLSVYMINGRESGNILLRSLIVYRTSYHTTALSA